MNTRPHEFTRTRKYVHMHFSGVPGAEQYRDTQSAGGTRADGAAAGGDDSAGRRASKAGARRPNWRLVEFARRTLPDTGRVGLARLVPLR